MRICFRCVNILYWLKRVLWPISSLYDNVPNVLSSRSSLYPFYKNMPPILQMIRSLISLNVILYQPFLVRCQLIFTVNIDFLYQPVLVIHQFPYNSPSLYAVNLSAWLTLISLHQHVLARHQHIVCPQLTLIMLMSMY